MPAPAQSTSPTSADVMQTINMIVTWILVLVGWWFVRWDNNRREDRRELREKIDRLISDIHDLEEKAYNFYTGPSTDSSSVLSQVSIKRGQDMLEARIEHIRNRTSHFKAYESVSKYRTDLMSHDFESTDRKPCEPNDRKLLEISHSAKRLIDWLEAEYLKAVR